jgi:hypothetical protein
MSLPRNAILVFFITLAVTQLFFFCASGWTYTYIQQEFGGAEVLFLQAVVPGTPVPFSQSQKTFGHPFSRKKIFNTKKKVALPWLNLS